MRAAAEEAGVRVRGEAAAVQLPEEGEGLPVYQVQRADPEDLIENRSQGKAAKPRI